MERPGGMEERGRKRNKAKRDCSKCQGKEGKMLVDVR